jgi:hypothetical protein
MTHDEPRDEARADIEDEGFLGRMLQTDGYATDDEPPAPAILRVAPKRRQADGEQ